MTRLKKMFYNTTKERGKLLKLCTDKATAQNDRIFAFYRYHLKRSFTPEDIWERLFTEDTPLTSIRRSISNLTASGHLIKLSKKKIGQFGRPIYFWKFKRKLKRRK